MDFSFEHLLAFVQEQWWVILIAAVVLIIIIKVVKALVKWAIVAAVIIALVLYGLNYEPFQEAVDHVVDTVVESSLNAAFQAMTGEAEDAEYEVNEDGTFTVQSKSIKLTGSTGSDKVTIYLHGVMIGEVPISSVIETYIETARSAAGRG